MKLFALNPIEPIVAILYETNEIEFINYSTKTDLKAITNTVKDSIK